MRSGIRMMICLAGVVGLLTRPSAAQEIVRFEASQPHAAHEIMLRGELYRPTGDGRFPAVILMHGCGGWQPAVQYTLHADAYYLVDHGFVVLNLDSFGPRRSGGGAMCESDSALRDALVYRTADAFDALRYLAAQPFVDESDIFLMGQSNGGSVAINAAKAASAASFATHGAKFRAVVAYYPWCGIFGAARVALVSPLLIFGGGEDDWVRPAECGNYRAIGAALQVVIYPEAVHSFDLQIARQRYMGKLIGGDAQAADDSRSRMLDFFVSHVGPADRPRVQLAAGPAADSPGR